MRYFGLTSRERDAPCSKAFRTIARSISPVRNGISEPQARRLASSQISAPVSGLWCRYYGGTLGLSANRRLQALVHQSFLLGHRNAIPKTEGSNYSIIAYPAERVWTSITSHRRALLYCHWRLFSDPSEMPAQNVISDNSELRRVEKMPFKESRTHHDREP